jgi:hypothetical protein
VNRPLLGEPDAPCRTCGAPLAADQRYCLQCGTRRAEARLPFLEILKGQAPQGTAPRAASLAPPPGQHGALGRVSANAVAIAGVACLVLALGVGVLIGGMNDGEAPAAAPAQIIRVGGATGAPAAAAPTTTAPPATTTSTTAGDAPARRTSASRKASESKAAGSTVRDLGRSSGGDYARRSARLPDVVGTGGRLPPKRAGTIGAGSDVESIG